MDIVNVRRTYAFWMAHGFYLLHRRCALLTYNEQAKPVSKHATDPQKVSHHIHRVGYHFRSDIVDEACEELGYIYHHGRFIKEAALQAQRQQSRMAQIMAKHGVPFNETIEETPEQVGAVIKELFPRIPDDDLNQILQHAWEKGSRRVGTNATLDLPRRVQLATIARIRHTYTDYDYLLHAFPWKDARLEVEQECLKKLLEWRGEDAEDDDVMEELVKDVIVLDDDDEDKDPNNGSEADDEDSTMEMDATSDTDVEIIHQRAADKDLVAKSGDEGFTSSANRYPTFNRSWQQPNSIARQKIGEARRQMQIQNGSQPSAYVQLPYEGRNVYVQPGQPMTVDYKTYGAEYAPETVTIGGQLFRRVRFLDRTLNRLRNNGVSMSLADCTTDAGAAANAIVFIALYTASSASAAGDRGGLFEIRGITAASRSRFLCSVA